MVKFRQFFQEIWLTIKVESNEAICLRMEVFRVGEN